jgi:hypothetical protein
MGNWLKTSQSFDADRHALQERKRIFFELMEALGTAAQGVGGNHRDSCNFGGICHAGDARTKILEIAATKEMSSFPTIRKYLEQAAGKALDNHKAFAEFCEQAGKMILGEIGKISKDFEKLLQKHNEHFQHLMRDKK